MFHCKGLGKLKQTTYQMKTIFITILITLISYGSYAQYPTRVASDSIRTEAEQLTHKYSAQLALTGVQIPLFKNVVEEYMLKAEKTIEAFEGRKELDALVELQARETLEMNDILTRLQYQLYKKLKFDYQPLKVIKTD